MRKLKRFQRGEIGSDRAAIPDPRQIILQPKFAIHDAPSLREADIIS